ncbi:alpha/beta hydrolase family protein [Altererythrobacter sp. Root672]|uniref:alpha/beta hydrolase family protein n=1 Tax=Altererythrobacter sp. Root672 TaxID=1736584 RepID=UPI001F2EE014|nr:alpha/beta fold hydrolase [Altererythrobacter sp. Root672]
MGRIGMTLVVASALIGAAASAAEAPPLEAYGNLPSFEDAALSQTGNSLAVLAVQGGQRKVIMFDAATMQPKRALTVGDTKIRDIEWIGDEALLMVTSQTEDLGFGFTTNQAEFERGVVIPAKAGEEVRVVFDKNRSMLRALRGDYGIREVDGRWTGFFGGIRLGQRNDNHDYYLEHTRPSLIALDFGQERVRSVSDPAREGERRSWLVGGGGKVVATLDIREDTGAWQIVDASGNHLADGTNTGGDVGLAAIGHDGSSVVYWAEDEEGYSRLYQVPFGGGSPPTEILADESLVETYRDPSDNRMIGYLRRGTTDEQVFFDADKQALAEKIGRAFKGRTTRMMAWTPNFSHVIVNTTGNQDSGSWFLLTSAQLKARLIGEERPQILAEEVGPISTFAYKAQDGLDLDGILTLPPGREAKNLPIVILPHGGPGSHDEERFDWWAQAYASRGYAVFQPNFRGSTNRDQDFQRAGYGQWGRKMQSDVSDGLAALAAQGIVDPRRACVVGASYGGYVALAGVTLQHGLYRCAVSVAGVSDLDLMFRTENAEYGYSKMIKHSLIEELGPRSGLRETSPRLFAAQADAPILLIHGRDDTVVPYEQSTKMADALKDAGKPFEFLELREEDHWLSRADTRNQMLAAAVAFVERYNPAE